MNTELIARLRKLSAENKSPRDAIDEAADALEAAQPKDPCGTCGKQVNYYRSGCPGCGAPVCCEACCRANQKSDALRGEIAYQLTKQLVIDMPTARAAVDSDFNASTGAAQPAPQVPMTDSQLDTAAKVLAAAFDYPWEHMPEQGRNTMRGHVKDILSAIAHHKIGAKP